MLSPCLVLSLVLSCYYCSSVDGWATVASLKPRYVRQSSSSVPPLSQPPRGFRTGPRDGITTLGMAQQQGKPQQQEVARKSDHDAAVAIAAQDACRKCGGKGRVKPKPGKNPINTKALVGSKWTACQTRLGARHYLVKGIRSKNTVDMSSTCGKALDRVKLKEISISELKDKSLWRSGWRTLEDIVLGQASDSIEDKCSACGGSGVSQKRARKGASSSTAAKIARR